MSRVPTQCGVDKNTRRTFLAVVNAWRVVGVSSIASPSNQQEAFQG